MAEATAGGPDLAGGDGAGLKNALSGGNLGGLDLENLG